MHLTKHDTYHYLIVIFFAIFVISCGKETMEETIHVPNTNIGYYYETTTIYSSVLIIDSYENYEHQTFSISPEVMLLKPSESAKIKITSNNGEAINPANYDFIFNLTDPRSGSLTDDGHFTAGKLPGDYPQAISIVKIENTPKGITYQTESISVRIMGKSELKVLSSIEIIPNNPTLLKNQITKLQAIGYDENGVIIPGVNFIWELNDPTLGKLNKLGYFTVEGRPGNYARSISLTGIWKNNTVNIKNDLTILESPLHRNVYTIQALPQKFYTDAGDSIQLRAIALNGLGEMVTGTQLRWSMANKKAGSIDGAGNFKSGDIPGIYSESIKVEAVIPSETGFVKTEDYASVIVRKQQDIEELHYVAVYPIEVTIDSNTNVLFTSEGYDKNHQRVIDTNIKWKVLKPNIGKIDDLGVFKPNNLPGRYLNAIQSTVSQIINGEHVEKYGYSDLVITGELYSGQIYPEVAAIEKNKTLHLNSIGLDQNNEAIYNIVTKWKVLDDSIGKIDKYGNFTASGEPGLYQNVIKAELSYRRKLSSN